MIYVHKATIVVNTQEVQVQHNRWHKHGTDVEKHSKNNTNGAIFLEAEEMPIKLKGISYRVISSEVQIPGKKCLKR